MVAGDGGEPALPRLAGVRGPGLRACRREGRQNRKIVSISGGAKGKPMKIKAIFQIEGESDVEKMIEGEDNREIWNRLIAEVSEFFPECNRDEVKLEKKVPEPVFVAKKEEGEVLCHVRCEQV
jgi:hypothetical protein